MKARLVVGLAFLLGAFVAAPVGAGVPDAAHSFVAPRVVICPAGDSVLVVIVRHADATPWAEGPVWADLCDCPGIHLSTVQPCGLPDTSSCQIMMLPDPNGVVEMPIAGGGLCPGGTVRVYAEGVPLAIRPEPASFDQNGDLKVDATDVAIVNGKIGTHDPGADFDGDGTVTMLDLAILLSHLGHAAPDAAASAATGRR
jgi:hypothetical protein